MGCDGGTIPTRDELVRLKKKPEQKDKVCEMVAKWKHCAISQEPLQQPIVACELGRLYNKDKVIELLLDRSKFEGGDNFDHIKGLKDIKVLQLTDNPAYAESSKGDIGDGYVDKLTAPYICPVSGLEMSGKYKFCYLLHCGCVFSQRALKEIKTDTCNKCGKPTKQGDMVTINGTEEEMAELRSRMEERRLQAKLEKKAKKKHKAPESLSTADDVPTSSKVARLDQDMPSTSKSTKDRKDKLTNGATRHSSKLTNGEASSKSANEKTGGSKKPAGIQKDPTASKAYKSLFNTCEAARNQPKQHWVTHNPLFY